MWAQVVGDMECRVVCDTIIRIHISIVINIEYWAREKLPTTEDKGLVGISFAATDSHRVERIPMPIDKVVT